MPRKADTANLSADEKAWKAVQAVLAKCKSKPTANRDALLKALDEYTAELRKAI